MLATMRSMQSPSYSAARPPAISVQKYWMPGEWAPCDICRAMRMVVNLTSICYTLSTCETYERCLHVCADKAECLERAAERKRDAES